MKRHPGLLTSLFFLALLVSIFIVTALGHQNGRITLEFNWPWIWHDAQGSVLANVISTLRLPRSLAAAIAGAALAVSGLLLQSVSRNPLADPFLLGISGGAALGVVLANAFSDFFGAMNFWLLPLAAFAGAQGATVLVLYLSRGTGRRMSLFGLILGGVVINAFCAAVTTFLLTRFDPLRLKITTQWMAGGIGYLPWSQLVFSSAGIVVALLLLRIRAAEINAFALGEEGASLVGVDTSRVLNQVTWMASILAGFAVSIGGLIGYIGLIVPHLVQLIAGRDFKSTLWLSAVLGALVLVVGDGMARTVLSPREIPVGVLAALIGTPVLLVLLRKELKGQG